MGQIANYGYTYWLPIASAANIAQGGADWFLSTPSLATVHAFCKSGCNIIIAITAPKNWFPPNTFALLNPISIVFVFLENSLLTGVQQIVQLPFGIGGFVIGGICATTVGYYMTLISNHRNLV